MTNAEILAHNISDWGAFHELCVRTRRGLHVGVVYDASIRIHAQETVVQAVDIWHLVPSWMTPVEALHAFAFEE